MTRKEQMNTNNEGRTEHTGNRQRSVAEWTTFAISAAVLIAIVGLISWLHLYGGDRPAVIVVEPQTDELRREDSGYYLPVIVRNEGDVTVEDLQVQGELRSDSGEPETADFTITFLVGGEEANGTFIFQRDPAQGELTTAAGSYKLP